MAGPFDAAFDSSFDGGGGETQTNTGLITPVGALQLKVFHKVVGTLVPTGALAQQVVGETQTNTGTITPTGALTISKVFKTLAGTIAPVGTLQHKVIKAFIGVVTPVGNLSIVTDAGFVQVLGLLTPVGTLQLKIFKAMGGSITPVGAATMVKNIPVAGGISLPFNVIILEGASSRVRLISGATNKATPIDVEKKVELLV